MNGWPELVNDLESKYFTIVSNNWEKARIQLINYISFFNRLLRFGPRNKNTLCALCAFVVKII